MWLNINFWGLHLSLPCGHGSFVSLFLRLLILVLTAGRLRAVTKTRMLANAPDDRGHAAWSTSNRTLRNRTIRKIEAIVCLPSIVGMPWPWTAVSPSHLHLRGLKWQNPVFPCYKSPSCGLNNSSSTHAEAIQAIRPTSHHGFGHIGLSASITFHGAQARALPAVLTRPLRQMARYF